MGPRWFGMGALSAVLFACSGSSSGNDRDRGQDEPPGASPEVQAFASDYVRAFCTAAARCCTIPEFSESHCLDIELTEIGLMIARSSKYVFHADLAARCLVDLETAVLCQDGVPTSCTATIEGSLPAGGDCNSLYECAYRPYGNDTCPYMDEQTRCKGPVGLGERCGWTLSVSGRRVPIGGSGLGICLQSAGHYCNEESGVCEELLPLGAACSDCLANPASCLERENCVVGAACIRDVCEPARVPGDPCSFQGDCAPGNFCSSPGNRCNAAWAPGTACTETDWYSCLDGSCENGVCRTELEMSICAYSNWL